MFGNISNNSSTTFRTNKETSASDFNLILRYEFRAPKILFAIFIVFRIVLLNDDHDVTDIVNGEPKEVRCLHNGGSNVVAHDK